MAGLTRLELGAFSQIMIYVTGIEIIGQFRAVCTGSWPVRGRGERMDIKRKLSLSSANARPKGSLHGWITVTPGHGRLFFGMEVRNEVQDAPPAGRY
jgi:hypothetical protein